MNKLKIVAQLTRGKEKKLVCSDSSPLQDMDYSSSDEDTPSWLKLLSDTAPPEPVPTTQYHQKRSALYWSKNPEEGSPFTLLLPPLLLHSSPSGLLLSYFFTLPLSIFSPSSLLLSLFSSSLVLPLLSLLPSYSFLLPSFISVAKSNSDSRACLVERRLPQTLQHNR
jgi:hypothetical protein